MTLRDSGQFCDDVAEAGGRSDVDTCLPALVVVVDDGRALRMAQDDGTQDSVSALESSNI